MASLGQNVGENPRHVFWNNKDTDSEEGWQSMMGFSCMEAVCEYTRYLHTWGGGGTPYNGLYGEAPPERGTFFRLQV